MLDPSKLQLAETLFERLVGLPAADRGPLLNQACGRDREIRDYVERLLLHDDSGMAGFLGAPIGARLQGVDDNVALPASIGGYRVLRRLGEGGMGVVYEGEQPHTQRRVAVKAIRDVALNDRSLRRFHFEAEILARLRHPGIALIYEFDVGEVCFADLPPRRQPFFAMELVEGQPLGEYADRRRLGLRDRLELLVSVCEAVHHAHQKGVIHRDLKPGNILVDAGGQPRILDFGVARVFDESASGQTAFTAMGQLLGTVAYMSPEQLSGDAHSVDTRSDVYSLGVVAYELLTGSPPIDVSNQPLPQALRTLAESEARPAGAIRPELCGDIEAILARALAREPAQRYVSAAEFGSDIRRYLNHEPVSARAPNFAYQLAKFARRNRGAVTAATLVAAALVIGLAGTIWQAIVATRQRDIAVKAEKAKDDALREAETARSEADERSKQLEDVAKFQASQLENLDAEEMGQQFREALLAEARASMTRSKFDAETIDARLANVETLLDGTNFTNLAVKALDDTIFERTLEAINKEFPDQPLVRARLQHTAAHTLKNLGLLDRAIEVQREALRIWREALGNDDRHTLSAINNLGHLLHQRGRLDEAEALLREAHTGYRRTLGNEHEESLSAASNLGTLLRDRRDIAGAEQLYREVLDTRLRVLGEDHKGTLNSYNNMALMLIGQGKRLEAETYHRKALEGRRRILGDDHPDTHHSMINLGTSLLQRGQFVEAESLFREALERSRRTLGDRHPDTLAALFFLGTLLREKGALAEAEPYLREAMEGRRHLLGSDHPKTLQTIGMYAAVLGNIGKPVDAEVLFREALERSRRVHGDDHPGTIAWINALGHVLLDQKKYAEAEENYRLALEARRRILGPEHEDTLPSINNVGNVLLTQNKLEEAEPYLKDAVEISRRIKGEDHPNTLAMKNNMARLLRMSGRTEEAEALGAEIVRMAKAKLPKEHQHIPVFMTEHAIAMAKLKRFAEAEADMLDAHERFVAIVGPRHDRTKTCVTTIAAMYDDWHTHEPDAGHDRKAVEWRARIDNDQVTPDP